MFNQADKLKHLIVGIVMSQVLFLLGLIVVPWWASLLISLGLSTLVMYGKELVWDKWMGRGTYNMMDFYAGLIGIAYGEIMNLIYALVL